MIGILSKRGQNRGFTLLEVVISMGLITIALLAVFRLQAQNLDLQSEAQFITLANHLAQDRMSQIQAGDELTEGSSSGDFGDDFPYFSYREEISEMPDLENLFKVKVSVFLDKKDATKDLSIETYLYRNQM